MLEERKIKLVVNIFPVSSLAVNDFKENYPYGHLHKMIKDIAHKNIIWVDAIEEFNRLGMTPQEVSINYQYNESHKNANPRDHGRAFIPVFQENKLISGI